MVTLQDWSRVRIPQYKDRGCCHFDHSTSRTLLVGSKAGSIHIVLSQGHSSWCHKLWLTQGCCWGGGAATLTSLNTEHSSDRLALSSLWAGAAHPGRPPLIPKPCFYPHEERQTGPLCLLRTRLTLRQKKSCNGLYSWAHPRAKTEAGSQVRPCIPGDCKFFFNKI